MSVFKNSCFKKGSSKRPPQSASCGDRQHHLFFDIIDLSPFALKVKPAFFAGARRTNYVEFLARKFLGLVLFPDNDAKVLGYGIKGPGPTHLQDTSMNGITGTSFDDLSFTPTGTLEI